MTIAIVWIVVAIIVFFIPMLLGLEDFRKGKAEENLVGLFFAAALWPLCLMIGGVMALFYGFCVVVNVSYEWGTDRMAKYWQSRKEKNK